MAAGTCVILFNFLVINILCVSANQVTHVPHTFPMMLGRGYDARSGAVLADLFHNDITDNPKRTQISRTSVEYSLVKSDNDARKLLGIDGKLALDIKTKVVDAGGEGAYLKDTESRDKFVELLVRVRYDTMYLSIRNSMTSARSDCGYMKPFMKGTHFIRSIRYGSTLVASLRFLAASKEDKLNIEAAIKGSVGIKGIMVGAEGKFRKLKNSLKDQYRMDIKLFTRTPINQVPDDIDTLMQIVKEFPSSMKQASPDGVPIEVELVPIEMLAICHHKPNWEPNPSIEADIDDLNKKYDDIRRTVREFNEWISTLNIQNLEEDKLLEISKFNERLTTVDRAFREIIDQIDESTESDELFVRAKAAYTEKQIAIPNRWYILYRRMKATMSVDGGWCPFTRWTDCIGGYKNRSRACLCPSPQSGGHYCKGVTDERVVCGDNLDMKQVRQFAIHAVGICRAEDNIDEEVSCITETLRTKYGGVWGSFRLNREEGQYGTSIQGKSGFYTRIVYPSHLYNVWRGS